MSSSRKQSKLSFSEHIGQRIRFFRKMRHISLDQMSEAVYKSKSTLSKYEHGTIPIDVNTLYDIAIFLGVSVNQFTDYELYEPKKKITTMSNPFGSMDHLYLYYYDGRSKRIVKSLLVMTAEPLTKDNMSRKDIISCQCYMDFNGAEDFTNCKYYFTGTMVCHDLVTHVELYNLTSNMDRIHFCILNPFHYNQETWGLELGISYNPISPHARKFLVSTTRILDENLSKDKLVFTKDELKQLKDLNMFILNTMEV